MTAETKREVSDDSTRRVGPCFYCGNLGPLTKEHSYPAWTYRQLGTAGERGRLLINDVLVDDGGVSLVAVYALCSDCNGSWSDTERKVSRWLGRSMRDPLQPFELGPGQRCVVAAWALKTALMLELAYREVRKPSFAPPSHFRWLYEHRDKPEPPPGCRVWLFGTEARINIPVTNGAMILSSETGIPPTAYLATFTIGFMGFHVFGPDIPRQGSDGVDDSAQAPELEPEGIARSLLVRIWPDAKVFRWPPARHATIDELPKITYWPRSAQGLNHPPDPGYRRTDGLG